MEGETLVIQNDEGRPAATLPLTLLSWYGETVC